MKNFFLFLIPLSLAITSPVFAQVEEEDRTSSSKDTIRIDARRFIYQGKIYRENSPYLTIGYGAGKNIGTGKFEQNMTITYHHFIGGIGVGGGYHTSKNDKVWWRSHQYLVDYHVMLGKRFEFLKHNIAAFAGPAYSKGEYIKWVEALNENRYFPFNTVGLVAELQYTYRLYYDVGIGLSAYTSLNKYYSIVGAQIHLFFSTAYVRSYD